MELCENSEKLISVQHAYSAPYNTSRILELNISNLQSTWWYDKRRQSLDIFENSFLQDSQIGQSHIQCSDIPILDLVKYVFQVIFFAHTT